MKKHLRRGRSLKTIRTWNGAAENSLIFNPLLMVALSVLLAIAAVTHLGVSRHRDDAFAAGDLRQTTLPVERRNDGNREFRSQRRPSVGAPSDSDTGPVALRAPAILKTIHQMDQVVGSAGEREQRAAAALKRFAESGSMAELRAVDRGDVLALADLLAAELSPSEVGSMLQEFVGLPADRVLTEEDVSSSLVGIYDALAGNHVEEVRPSVLMVTDAADVDGHITGQAHVLPAGTERVYAVFENDHALKELDQVMAVWRNPEDEKMVFTEFEPIRQGSAYNYVWLDVESGWPAGQYQVELFHPEAQSLLLASESFSIR